MQNGTVHVVGAGLSGLSAAVNLAGRGVKVVVHELARHAGGRCRSYFEPALGLTIDNGNHLLLSGNHAALALLETIGARHALVGPDEAEFAFANLATGARWLVRINAGPLPWWVLSSARRVPGTSAFDYLRLGRLLLPAGDGPLSDVLDCNGVLYESLIRPVFLAALNTDPPTASAALARAIVRETLAKEGMHVDHSLPATGWGPRSSIRLLPTSSGMEPRYALIINCVRSTLPMTTCACSISARIRLISVATTP